MERIFFIAGSISALIAVVAGAFGAHGLKNKLAPDLLNIFEVGARYQMYHAIGLIIVAIASGRLDSATSLWAGWLFIGGTILFSGSLYALSLTGTRWLGAITPIGGLMFIAGWACLAWAAWQR